MPSAAFPRPALALALAHLAEHPDATDEAVSARYQAGLEDGAATRRRSGAYYTPRKVVDEILDRTLDPWLDRTRPELWTSLRLIDPCCGAGHFLLGAHDRLARRLRGIGHPEPVRAAAACLSGTDTDADVLTLARRLLERAGAGAVQLDQSDALFAESSFDIVVGNPPFLGQLGSDTVLDPAAATQIRTRFPGVCGPYTDPAWLHLLASFRRVRPGGRVGLIQPRSILAARDAAGIRRVLEQEGRLVEVWDGGAAFPGVGVRVCGIVLEPGGGAEADPTRSWARHLPAPPDLPRVVLRPRGTVGDIATTAADFRDEYYGLIPFTRDGAQADEHAFPRLITTGMVDAARCRWGERPGRFARRAWAFPRVDRAAAQQDPRLARWLDRRLRPKLLLATQTRALEVVVDAEGAWLTVTPLISVYPREGQLWHVAAALLSPVATSWAHENYAGVALASDALKLSATQVLQLPLPDSGADWDAAAVAVEAAHREPTHRRDHLYRAGRHMLAAYEVEDTGLLDGWFRRI